MAKPNQVPESSMEEILASIRKIISEDEAKAPIAKPEMRPLSARPASNISPLFRSEPSEAPDDAPQGNRTAAMAARPVTDEPDDWISRRPIYPQFGDMRGTSEAADVRGSSEKTGNRAAPEREGRPTRSDLTPAKPAPSGSLLSPHADAAVASAFNHLASTIFSNNSRSIEQVAEDMLQPMLKDWLDANLPPLVERLVREEIERVSRRR